MKEHPIIEIDQNPKMVLITVDGKELCVQDGMMIAAALLENGIRINRYTRKEHKPSGVVCGIGQCTDCVMVVNGQPKEPTCITPVEAGMVIETQGKEVAEDAMV